MRSGARSSGAPWGFLLLLWQEDHGTTTIKDRSRGAMHPAPPVSGGPWDDDLQEPVPLPLLTLPTTNTIYSLRAPSTAPPAPPAPPPLLPSSPPPLPLPPAHPPCSCPTSDPTLMGPGCWRGEGGERTGGWGWGGSGGGCGTGRGGAGGARRAGHPLHHRHRTTCQVPHPS